MCSKDVDWLVGVILMTADRNQLFDFPYPWAFDYASLILPYPTESANTDAPFKPYTYPVNNSMSG